MLQNTELQDQRFQVQDSQFSAEKGYQNRYQRMHPAEV